MIRSAYHTISGGLQYARLLLSSDKNAKGAYGGFPPPSTTHAVLIVPGWLGPASVGDTFAYLFTRKKIPACTFHIGFNAMKPYSDLLMMLKRYVADLRRACPELKRLDIVAHSMGGPLAIDIIMDGTLDGLQVQLVTLGSMHRGTWLALLGCPFSHSARALLPFRRRFQPMNDYGRLKLVPFLSIAGLHDLIVPPDRSTHPLAESLEVRADHGTLLFKKSVFTAIFDFFKEQRELVPLAGP